MSTPNEVGATLESVTMLPGFAVAVGFRNPHGSSESLIEIRD
jgi:hypothetical protein